MFDKILGALTIVRHAVAIVVVTGAAGAMVAGSADLSGVHDTARVNTTTAQPAASETDNSTTSTQNEVRETKPTNHDTRVEKTTGIREPKPAASEAPKPDRTAKTEPTHEPKATEAPKTERTPKTEPSPKPNTESLSVLIKDCLTKYEAARNSTDGAEQASRACRSAIEASGLSSSEFWTRFGPKPTRTPEPARKTEPMRTPETTRKPEPSRTPSVTTAQLELMVRDCFAKYLAAKNTGEGGAAAAEACTRAIAASGLSRDAFFAKFGTPGSN
jgi:outer membrane biosynthesis protein TonB